MKSKGMSKIILTAALAVMWMVSGALAGEGPVDEAEYGFSGSIFMGGAYSRGELSLEDASEDDNKTLASLSQSPATSSGGGFLVGGDLNYLFSTGTMVTLDTAGGPGMNMEGDYGLVISQYAGDLGTFSMAGYYSEKDVWSDPFVTGSARSKTEMKTLGVVLAWEEILETEFSLRYGYEDADVENDISGSTNSRLKRDGSIHHLGLDWGLFSIGAHEMTAGLLGEIGNIDGDAYAFKGGQASLGYTFHGNGWEFETGLYLGKRDYDGIHPRFGKEREDTRYGIDTAWTLYNPLGFENYFISLFAGYDKADSNIGFYDQSAWSAGAGIGLRF
ncbi:MAG: DUF2860 family protein [Desulfobacter sp.]|nr:MAG: DUF2860 family protein [Desulfobacter sp.]